MERWPVRFVAAAVATSALALLMAVLGWGHADRARAAFGGDKLPGKHSGPGLATAPGESAPQPANPGTGLAKRPDPPGTVGEVQPGQPRGISRGAPPRRHVVQKGDTLWELTRRYGVGLDELLQVNPLVAPGHLKIGQEIVVPAGAGTAGALRPLAASGLSLGSLFTWPVLAPISSPFGPRDGRNHAGVDLAANHGDSIRAARNGQVILAGAVSGYGLTVIVRHPDGTRTLYAHCAKLLVRQGEQVRQGEMIALVGSTGISTGPHLHFEIIVNDMPQDPLRYLPVLGKR